MIAILHNIRSMHNVGSVLRTADGLGCVEKIYLCGITPAPVDRFGRPRSQVSKVSLGAEESIKWEKLGSEYYNEETWEQDTEQLTGELVDQLISEEYKIFAIEQHKNSIPYFSINKHKITKNSINELIQTFTLDHNKLVLLLGHEIHGIPETILKKCHAILEIPMKGQKNSLNVSVAFGIVAYSLISHS